MEPLVEMNSPRTLTLARSDERTETALRSGALPGGVRAIARAVVAGTKPAAEQVVFELLPGNETRRPAGIGPWMLAIRAYSLTATLMPCVAVAVFLAQEGRSVSWGVGLSALLGVVLLQVAINVFNDLEDYRRLIDLPGTLGGSGVIQKGWWTPAALRALSWSALGLGALAGLPAVVRHPEVLVGIALIAGFGTLGYSARRFGMKYIALGDVLVWVMCGPALTLGIAAALGAPDSRGVLWLGSFFGFLAVHLLHVNNLQDMELDRSRGVTTLAQLLGFTLSKHLIWVLQILAASALIIGVVRQDLPVGALLGVGVQALIVIPWWLRVRKALGPESAPLAKMRFEAAQIHLLSGLGLTAGFVLSWVLK